MLYFILSLFQFNVQGFFQIYPYRHNVINILTRFSISIDAIYIYLYSICNLILYFSILTVC